MRLLNKIFCLLLLLGTYSVSQAQIPAITSIFGSNNPFRTGDVMAIVGTNLFAAGSPTACDSIVLLNTTTSDTFRIPGSSYLPASTPSEISFVIPPRIDCGTYDVKVMSTIGGSCPGTQTNSPFSSTLGPPVTVTIHDRVGFTYPGGGIYCVGEPNPQPIFDPNTDVTNLNFFTNPAVSGLFLSSSSGEILIHQGVVGVHDVILTTTNAPACRMTDTFQIEIKANLPANYSYPKSTYCPNADSAVPNPLPGIDTIFSIPSLAWYNQDSGVIDLTNTNPGTYVIYFEADPDLCLTADTTQLIIQNLEQADFFYDTVYCNNQGTAVPNINYLPSNFVFTSGAGLTFTANGNTTGEVNLTATPVGNFSISCGPLIAGGCQTSVSVPFKIRALPDPSFAYASDTFCVTAGTVNPTQLADPTGVFRDTSFTLVITNPQLGTLDISASLPNLQGPGPYYLEHVVDDGVCRDSAGTFLYILNTSNVTVGYPVNQYCQGDGSIYPVFTTGALGGTFIADPPLPNNALDSLTGELILSNVPGDTTYNIDYVQAFVGCSTTDNVATGLIVDSLVRAAFGPLANGGYFCQSVQQDSILGFTPNPAYPNWSFSVEINGVPAAGATNQNFLVTSNLPVGGFYDLRMVHENGSCSDTLRTPIFIEGAADASFEYLLDTLCGDADDLTPFMSGDSNGVFSFSHPDPSKNLVINQTTGVINVQASDDDSLAYTIYYDVGNVCTARDSDNVVILPANAASFQFGSVGNGLTEFCTTTDSVQAIVAFPGGSFSSSSPDSCIVDSTTGVLLVNQCFPGEYSVFYQLDTNSACEARDGVVITILQADTGVSWEYVDSVFCPNDSAVAPLVSGLDSTSYVFSSTGLVFTDINGSIDLTASDSGFYYVTLQVLGQCSFTITDSLTVLPYVDPFFNYSQPFYCTTDTHPRPAVVNPGGTFAAIDNDRDTINFINPFNGQINLDSITSNAQSPLTIFYTPNAGCTFTSSSLLTINVGPEAASLDIIPSDTICQGDSIRIEAGGGDSYQFLINDTTIITSSSPEFVNAFTISPNTSAGSINISVFVGNTSACARRIDTMLVTNPVPEMQFVDLPTTVNSGQNISIDVEGLVTSGIFFDWQALEVGNDDNINFAPSTGRSGPVGIGQETFFTTNVSLTDPTSPGQIYFVVTPFTNDCPGITIRDTINLNPEGQPIFIPEVFTPNGDGINDTWQIQLQQDVDPNNYTMLVFNRGGGLVYTMSPLIDTWDGGTLPDAVYWWKLIDDRTNSTVLTGGVTMIRKRLD